MTVLRDAWTPTYLLLSISAMSRGSAAALLGIPVGCGCGALSLLAKVNIMVALLTDSSLLDFFERVYDCLSQEAL